MFIHLYCFDMVPGVYLISRDFMEIGNSWDLKVLIIVIYCVHEISRQFIHGNDSWDLKNMSMGLSWDEATHCNSWAPVYNRQNHWTAVNQPTNNEILWDLYLT